jgi:hypothetical protein
MDCIFKMNGYVPRNHVCAICEPLENLLLKSGCSGKNARDCSKTILRAFSLIKLEDTFRDESLPRKFIAKAMSVHCLIRLPRTVRNKTRETNVTVQRLESQNTDPSKYVLYIAKAGASIFDSAAKPDMSKDYLRVLGATLTGAILLQDMTKDLPSDVKTGRFNPLKSVETNFANALAKKYSEAFKNLADPVLATNNMPQDNPLRWGNLTRQNECGGCAPKC